MRLDDEKMITASKINLMDEKNLVMLETRKSELDHLTSHRNTGIIKGAFKTNLKMPSDAKYNQTVGMKIHKPSAQLPYNEVHSPSKISSKLMAF